MKRISAGWQMFISIMIVFAVFVLAIGLFLNYDLDLSGDPMDDSILILFLCALSIFFVVMLLIFRRRVDSNIARRFDADKAELRRQLSQNIAHELKTPVASIQGYLETILSKPDIPEETRKQFLERSHAQTLRLATLIGDIDTLNRMDEEMPDLSDFQQVDLSETVRQVARETAQQLEARQMVFRNYLPDGLCINGNAELIYSVFRNLMDNAIAYAGEGTTVTLYGIPDRDFWHFTFCDNGIGVAPENMGSLFDRFFRVDKGRSRRNGGTGLGLAIVKNAILLHGGHIEAKPAHPGLCFEFSLKK